MASVGQNSIFGMVAAALAILAPTVGSADAPSRVVGTVTDFHGKYGVVVRDARGRVIDVALHQGTIIKPEGLRLERGMVLTIIGQAGDRAFAATEIDTAYQLPPSRSPKTTAVGCGPERCPLAAARRRLVALQQHPRRRPQCAARARGAGRPSAPRSGPVQRRQGDDLRRPGRGVGGLREVDAEAGDRQRRGRRRQAACGS